MAVGRHSEVVLGQTLTALCRIPYFLQRHTYVCEVFILLNLNLSHVMIANSEAPVSFHGLFSKGVLNIRDINMAVEKYSRLYRPINVFVFRMYSTS
jgi:hypothetical protein